MPQLIQCSRPDLWSGGEVIWAASPALADVLAAIALADPGDTVRVPAGSASWGAFTLTKHISVIGGYGGTTTINSTSSSYAIKLRAALGEADTLQRFSGFTINGGSTYAVVDWGECDIVDWNLGTTIMKNVRLDNCNIRGGTYGIRNGSSQYGVVDNCVFGTPASRYTYVIWGDGIYHSTQYITSPQSIWIPGSNSSLYFEDNYCYIADGYRLCIHNCDGRGAYRYNTIDYPTTGAQGIMDLHGCQDITDFPSAFGVEYYGNIANNAPEAIAQIRAGKSRFFYNTHLGSTPHFDFYWGVYMVCPVGYDPEAQMIHDTYCWNNRRDYTGATGTHAVGTTHAPVCGLYGNRPTAGRDFVNESTTTPSVTYGPLASRPATCVVGQAYWATDQSTTNLTNFVGDINTYPSRQTIAGTLYVCRETNVWTEDYSPYAYPHPVRGM